MKLISLPLPFAAAALVCAAVLAVATIAQTPEAQQPPAGAPGAGQRGQHEAHREWPKPTNLQVLPKDLTGEQVRAIMEKWQGALGVHCNACHAEDPKNIGPNGRPRLNFADDSKQEKRTARLMYTMTQKINDDYISMVQMDHDDDAHEGHDAHDAHEAHEGHEGHEDHNVTCGTCHRGHQHPEAFVPPPEEHRPGAPGQPAVPR